jgi:hypothetical protein
MSSLKDRLLAACAVTVVVFTGAVGTSWAGSAQKVNVSLELVGQVINSPAGVSPATSIQFGCVAYLHGLTIFTAGAENESTARLTFFTNTTTLRVTNNGPLRIVSREGTVTVYNDPSGNGSFASPDSFRDGTPVLVATLRQQVILNTLTGVFTALNVNKITRATRFTAGTGEVQLGKVGGQFRTVISGQLNASPPPSAYIAGYTIPANDPPKPKQVRSK